MKKPFFLSLILLLFILYYFLFPLSAAKEYIWTPSMVQRLDEADGKIFPLLDEPVVIHSGGYMGILENDEESIVREDGTLEIPNGTPLRVYSFSHTFESTGRNRAVLRNRINNRYVYFEGPGYPLIQNNHYYLADLSSGILREVDTIGETTWEWEGVSPITALSAGDLHTAFGTLDGRVRIFGKDGKEGLLQPFPGSIYGLSLSPDSRLMAVVEGLKEQTLILFQEEVPLQYEEVLRVPLTSHYARPVKVIIPDKSSSVWVEQPGQILRVLENGTTSRYPVLGSFLTMIPDEESQIVYILSSTEEGRSCISIRSVSGDLLLKELVTGVPVHFLLKGNQLSLIIDGKVILLKRENF